MHSARVHPSLFFQHICRMPLHPEIASQSRPGLLSAQACPHCTPVGSISARTAAMRAWNAPACILIAYTPTAWLLVLGTQHSIVYIIAHIFVFTKSIHAAPGRTAIRTQHRKSHPLPPTCCADKVQVYKGVRAEIVPSWLRNKGGHIALYSRKGLAPRLMT